MNIREVHPVVVLEYTFHNGDVVTKVDVDPTVWVRQRDKWYCIGIGGTFSSLCDDDAIADGFRNGQLRFMGNAAEDCS